MHRCRIIIEWSNIIGYMLGSSPVTVYTTAKTFPMKNFQVMNIRMTWMPTWQHFCLGSSPKVKILGPGRALIHVFNNPSATEGYLSWGYLSMKLEFITPYQSRVGHSRKFIKPCEKECRVLFIHL